MAHIQETAQLLETVPEETQTVDLLDKDFKSGIRNIFKEVKKTMSKGLET